MQSVVNTKYTVLLLNLLNTQYNQHWFSQASGCRLRPNLHHGKITCDLVT